MNCIAHRGFAGVNPENTLPAVRDAVDSADGVEVDVRRCGSGELVVCHDETVDRTTDGSGPVADFTAAELDALSVEDSDAGVPTLAAVVDVVPPAVTLHAEVKERGLGDDLESLVADAHCPVVVSSFRKAALREIDELPTALVTVGTDDAVKAAASLGCDYVHPHVWFCTASFVGRAHGAGVAVNAWTVRKPRSTKRVRDRGADGVITDFPGCCPVDS